MALSADELDLISRLSRDRKKNAEAYLALDDWYELKAHVLQLGLAIPPALADFETIANWCRLSVDSVARLMRYQGMRFPDKDGPDERLAYVHQANDLDEEVPLGILDALIYGRSYICVGTNDDDADAPLITVEDPIELSQLIDPRTRRTTAVLRRYEDTEGTGIAGRKIQLGTLYQPDKTQHVRQAGNGRWVEDDRDEHELGVVPVAPLVNRARTRKRHGVSEMTDVIPLVAAAARALTNLQVAQETHAVPQRAVLGASKGDFVDKDGNPLTVWESYFGAIWALQNKDAKIDTFSASDLRNFHETVKHYALLASGLTNLPAAVFGFQTDNPASAEAIRGMRLQLISGAEYKIGGFSGSLEHVNRIVLRFLGASAADLTKARSLESMWADASMSTRAEKADAIVKLVQGDNPILPIEAAWDELGYTETKKAELRKQLLAQRRERADADLLGSAAEAFRRGLPAPSEDGGAAGGS
ncbi:MAG: phage portal protein [Frankiales bacterium]|nr:phage portal protein [Frankiales bacterium]